MKRLPSRFAAFAGSLALAACHPDPDPGGPYRAFVPVVVRSDLPGRVPWTTEVVLTSRTAQPVLLRRWPPGKHGEESEALRVSPAEATAVRPGGVGLPGVSSLLFSALEPFQTSVRVVRADQPDLEPLPVPVLATSQLARPGDVLRLGTFRQDAYVRSHFCVTVPATEAEAIPFLLELKLHGVDGSLLATSREAAPGVPIPTEDPWKRYGIPAGIPFDLEARFLRSVRGRRPVLGLWIYGIEQEKATGRSHFLPTKVERGSP